MQIRTHTSRPTGLAKAHRPLLRAVPAVASRNQAAQGPVAPAPVRQDAFLDILKASTLVGAATVALLAGFWCLPETAIANELGKDVFNGNCAACHMGGRNSVAPEKTLDKAALEQYLAGGFKLESIIYQVNNGKGAMPAWADRLDEDEIAAVAQYVLDSANAGWDSQ